MERPASQLWESAAVVVEPKGRVVVRTGSVPHGQGHETSFAQIAAALLQVHPDDVGWQDGRLWVRGVPKRAVSWQVVAAAAYQPQRLPPDLEIGLPVR
ncbi:MAG: hypothetical protein QN152_04045 [Armatimonadota bacterium]|nr:hypothetical protein [Armatimonadota bacterium]MDR7538687.1 hypothetical protein [Armatimonadota bacterium]